MQLASRSIFAVFVVAAVAHAAPSPPRSIDDYRYFRALSIDLVGRAPTRAEISLFERADFDWDKWIDERLKGPGYAERLTRVYMDLLRLEDSPAVNFAPPSATLHRQQVTGPEGRPLFIYFRQGQRRARDATDGEFCLTKEESGLEFINSNTVQGTPKPVSQSALDANTVVVRPWWLYRDFHAFAPSLRYRDEWTDPDPLYQPIDELIFDLDKRPTIDIRVCREEAQTADTGTIHTTGRKPPPKSQPPAAANPPAPPLGRLRPLPFDDGYAVKHAGEPISCRSALALSMSVDCGCGHSLQFCMPGDSTGNDPRAFAFPTRTPIGIDRPIANGPQSVSAWHRFWWSQEGVHFLDYLFAEDRDFRELLTARWSLVNGPLAQFYRASAPASCCNREKAFDMTSETEPLFDPKRLPEDLFPSDVRAWRFIPDRGPHASGILTTPVFLTKFASRRARAAVLYNALLCKSFVSGKDPLLPSSEPNLMVRPGCSNCHATLEPIAAWFSRIEETEWVYLPEWQFPLKNLNCKKNQQGKIPGFCEAFYDPAFSDGSAGLLRGAYASVDHAAAGATGAAAWFTAQPEYASCAVSRVTSSLLGRPLTDDDADLVKALTDEFVAKGYRMRALVRAIVRSASYRRSNNVASTAWRGGGK